MEIQVECLHEKKLIAFKTIEYEKNLVNVKLQQLCNAIVMQVLLKY
jgi:hypothetical protein